MECTKSLKKCKIDLVILFGYFNNFINMEWPSGIAENGLNVPKFVRTF